MSDQPTLVLPVGGDGPGPAPRTPNPWRAALIAVLVTLALAVPAAIILVLRGGDGADPVTPPLAAPASPAPSAPPSTPPDASPTPAPAAPDGRIALGTLQNSTLVIPPWPADNLRGPSGPLRFRDGVVTVPPHEVRTGEAPYGAHVVLWSATYGDVDHDGRAETIAPVECLIEGGSIQLVAFDRDSDGRIITLGTVVSTTGEVRDIDTTGVRVGGTGTVTVRVADYQGCCGDTTPTRWQTRRYRWTGGRFTQAGGPTAMPANPAVTQTRLTTGDLVLGPVSAGYRTGTLAVTLRHGFGARPDRVRLAFSVDRLEPIGTAWPATTVRGDGTVTITVKAPPSRGTVTYRYAFRHPIGATASSMVVEAEPLSARGAPLSEVMGWDNAAEARIRTVN
ncbi:hypothetical protein [Spirilliplanes yamanashiensis]|uniref:Uncharacterized protein n=1 Tax=Spirilliplanes yamanashiensis TaxID=42233 RepID=A0A8J3YF38_9ACTN|nr:hypothetical protein [Spirilliplanes yamanashiensis]MDP9818321.1 hypothetical protein [Spirilliplanes yamanashiensis]GIJ06770.1 hypothetical protein Sya03_61220 [Spirilliplanes yamanashiensis]